MPLIKRSSLGLIAYGSVALPWCLAALPVLTYVPAFYAQELALSPGLVGLVFLAVRLWDGVFDVLVGWLSDNSTSRFGRRKPWVVVASPCLMLATWFLCNPPLGSSVIYLGVWAALFYTAWSALGIPYLSWGAELATDYRERSRVTAFREVFTMLGNLLFAAMPLVFLTTDAPLKDAVLLIAVAVIVLLPITVPLAVIGVPDPIPIHRSRTQLFGRLDALRKDRTLILFIFVTLAMWTGSSVVNSLAVFSFGVGLQLPDKLFVLIFVIYISALCSMPLTMRLTRFVEKHHLLAAANATQAVAFCALLVTEAGNLFAVVAAMVAVGVASGAFLMLPTSMLADIIDHGELVTNERHSGSYVAVYNLAMKTGLALGVGISFGMLDFVGFAPGAAIHTAIDARNIRALGYGLPALLLVLSVVLLFKYPLSSQVQRQLRSQIDARRGTRGGPAQ